MQMLYAIADREIPLWSSISSPLISTFCLHSGHFTCSSKGPSLRCLTIVRKSFLCLSTPSMNLSIIFLHDSQYHAKGPPIDGPAIFSVEPQIPHFPFMRDCSLDSTMFSLKPRYLSYCRSMNCLSYRHPGPYIL